MVAFYLDNFSHKVMEKCVVCPDGEIKCDALVMWGRWLIYQLSTARTTITLCPLECSSSIKTLVFTQWLPSCGKTKTLPPRTAGIMEVGRQMMVAKSKNMMKSSMQKFKKKAKSRADSRKDCQKVEQ